MAKPCAPGKQGRVVIVYVRAPSSSRAARSSYSAVCTGRTPWTLAGMGAVLREIMRSRVICSHSDAFEG